MAYLGRYRQGDTVRLQVRCTDASQTPVLPADPPQATVYSPGNTKLLAASLPIRDRHSLTGLFSYPLYLGGDYATAGHYQVRYVWKTGSHHGIEVDQFEVIAGGHADGAVTSLYSYRRPQADFLVHGLESGKIIAGRNPRV